MINCEQGFVRSESSERVIARLKEVLADTGFQYCPEPLPKHNKRKSAAVKKWRHFLVSTPIDGWVGIFEDHKYVEQELVQELSAKIQTSAIWLSYSETVEELAYAVYESGTIIEQLDQEFSKGTRKSVIVSGVRPRSPEELKLYDAAMEFYNHHSLPLKFYSYESIDEMANKNEYFTHLNFKSERSS